VQLHSRLPLNVREHRLHLLQRPDQLLLLSWGRLPAVCADSQRRRVQQLQRHRPDANLPRLHSRGKYLLSGLQAKPGESSLSNLPGRSCGQQRHTL
jgi:hypothetical protein